MRKRIALAIFAIMAPLLSILAIPASSANNHNSLEVIQGTAVTGANRLFSEPVWDVGQGFGGGGWNFVFGYNENGDTPIPLTESTPGETIIATGVDPGLAAILPPNSWDPALENVPFRDVATIINFAGDRAQVPSVFDVPGDQASKSAPNGDITLDDWLEAEAKLRIKCRPDGTADIRIRAKKLIPNGVYTLWGVWFYDHDGDGVNDAIEPLALGGVPNAMIADSNGKAYMERTLNFCPMDTPNLITVNIAFHSDGMVYGAMPELPLAGLPGGTVTHDQINFPINVLGEFEG